MNTKFTAFFVIMLIICNILYQLGLYACPVDDPYRCGIFIKVAFTRIISFTLLSSISFSAIAIYLLIHHKWRYLIAVGVNLLVLFGIFSGFSYTNHGSVNMIVTISIFVLSWIGIYIFNCLSKIVGSRFYLLVLFLVSCIMYLYLELINSSFDCSDWEINFKGTKIDNEVGCALKKPTRCYGASIDKVFDLSAKLGTSCDYDFGNPKTRELLYNNSDLAFFPVTSNFNITQKSLDRLYKEVNSKIVLVKFTNPKYYLNNYINGTFSVNRQEIIDYYLKEGYEIFIDFISQPNPKVHQILHFNKTLSSKSKTRREKSIKSGKIKDPIVSNVLFIFVDSISRSLLKHKLPQTYKLLENYYDNNTTEYENFQFLKFNSIVPNTFGSMVPAFFGRDSLKSYEDDIKMKATLSIFEILKKNGFITSMATGTCTPAPFGFYKFQTNLFKSEQSQLFNHENFSIHCDPNFAAYSESYGTLDKSFTSSFKRCQYGKAGYEYAIDYANQLLNSYKENNQFLTMYFMDAHEPTNEVLRYLDNNLYLFLSKNLKQLAERDFGIVIMSDHGLHLSILQSLFLLDDMTEDLSLPYLNILLPRKTADKYKDSLKFYENRLVSQLDLYVMLNKLVGIDAKSDYRTINIFDSGKDVKRECSDLLINELNCKCK